MASTMIDLSREITDGLVTYPGYSVLPTPVIRPQVDFDDWQGAFPPGGEFRIDRIEMVGNTGTYLDTPAHRYRDGFDVADLPLESVADLPGVVIDARAQALGPEVFEGRDLRGRAVLVHTGWARYWGTERYGSVDHPHVTGAAAELLANAGAALVGIDSVNIDDTSEAAGGWRAAHSTLLAAGVLVVEHLCNLDRLGDASFRFFAVPLKARGMGTFPVRAFAVR
ncbi:MAG: cyclase family protein [Propionibacteriales bacterium]|nr:cyclase family protein [Propionibacteriales bacterium]